MCLVARQIYHQHEAEAVQTLGFGAPSAICTGETPIAEFQKDLSQPEPPAGGLIVGSRFPMRRRVRVRIARLFRHIIGWLVPLT